MLSGCRCSQIVDCCDVLCTRTKVAEDEMASMENENDDKMIAMSFRSDDDHLTEMK